VLLSRLLRAPQAGEAPRPAMRLTHSQRDYTPLEMLKSPVFWVLYAMFVMVAASGLMATAQIAPIAKDFGLADQQVSVVFVSATTLSAALVIDNILNGLARPFFGWISDVIGREITLGIVFTLGAFAYWGLGAFGHTPYMFILLAGFIFFHLRRNLQSVSRDRDRYLRREIRHSECGPALHREGRRRLGRAVGERHQELQRQLALGLCDRRDHEPDSRGAGALCAQADAAEDYEARLRRPAEDRQSACRRRELCARAYPPLCRR
jgi:hypothetical protein